MTERTHAGPELDLDPDDWGRLRERAHAMLDVLVDSLENVRSRPVWRPLPDDVRHRLSDDALPMDGVGLDAVCERFLRDVLPYPTGNTHPRFWGWVMGTGTADGLVADMLAAGMNAHLAGFQQSATEVEKTVTRWLLELMGFPSSGSGILVSGATVANLVCLAVARRRGAGFDVKELGLAAGARTLTVYASEDTHSCVAEACDLLGLGRAALRFVSVDDDHRVRLDALREAIARDRREGARPLCVVGNAGTVNTGATDDLAALADLCADEDLWLHVDGAFGALARLPASTRHLVDGIERADSVAFDLHKWGYVPYDVGCALFRDGRGHGETFARQADYLATAERGVAVGMTEFAGRGIQLSRSFRALKVWMALQVHGARGWARAIEQNVAQARFLAELVTDEAELELLAPVPMNIVCFRYAGHELAERDLDALNAELLVRLQEDGIAVPSGTRIGGRFALRVAITNHRSRREDFSALVDAVLRLGRELAPPGAVTREPS